MDLLKAHGSQNDILIVQGSPDRYASPAELPELVRRLCDRSGPLGADGVYFVDTDGKPAPVAFFNPDGTAAALCGNGMRAVGRLVIELRETDAVDLTSGGFEFTVRLAGTTPEGVVQTAVELPPVDFDPPVPIVAGGGPHISEVMPCLHPGRRYTALAVPNSHLVSVADNYDESDLIEAGRNVAAHPGAFPVGANVSHVLPLADAEIFVRTYERGAGLTLACGSAVAAGRAVCSRLGLFAPDQPVVVRNAGGVARSWLREVNGGWAPVLEGNATYVFRTTVDPSELMRGMPMPLELAEFPHEAAAFAEADARNLRALSAAGVSMPAVRR